MSSAGVHRAGKAVGTHDVREKADNCFFFSLKKRTLRGDLIAVCNYLIWVYREDRARHFSEVHSDRMRGKGHKLEHGEFCLDIRKNFFSCRDDQILEDITQTGCGPPVLGGIWKSTGHCLDLPGLDLLWACLWPRQPLEVPSNLNYAVILTTSRVQMIQFSWYFQTEKWTEITLPFWKETHTRQSIKSFARKNTHNF